MSGNTIAVKRDMLIIPQEFAYKGPDSKAAIQKPVVQKVKEIAKIGFGILLSVGLFAINPGISFVSFVIGIAFSKAIEKAVLRIQAFMIKYKWPVIVGSVLMAGLVLPVFIATGTVIWNLYTGSYLSLKAQDQLKKREN
ncbi:MAG: hypothetical protein BGO14_04105 [Chlamydiales bacterium 38-26]|nr:hypothetical protein [Chlamydiales bacterium]OJV07681.1 MAG: hypothetical protein BGO14_04105 [Chlamydiales bacterium 38-26]